MFNLEGESTHIYRQCGLNRSLSFSFTHSLLIDHESLPDFFIFFKSGFYSIVHHKIICYVFMQFFF